MKPPKMPEPPGAYGPTQYPFIGMNCSFCAEAVVTAPANTKPSRAVITAFIAILLGKNFSHEAKWIKHLPQQLDCQQWTLFPANIVVLATIPWLLQRIINGGRAITAASPCRSAIAARVRAARRSGRR